ncbi:TPA: LlaJI family restriction endonuclease [Streptococcus suis]|nr:LlaJI family restriction endonuclease [Streptococcus suis]HEM5071602.1 LlaJI family restriction endonuclease [Streptococcus suis]HEP1818351.1 LlaJI family restriction endonuclease [Streptococcus suis]
MENKLKTHFLTDGEELDGDIALKIPDYIRNYGSKKSCNFVGMILQDKDVFYAFPKQFEHSSLSIEEKTHVMKGLLQLLYRGGSGSGTGIQNEFPFDAYQVVVSYMKKYGLYQRQSKIEKMGYSGRINWNKTIRKSNSIVQKNGIVYMPFVTVHNVNYSEFISECMEFVLSYTFDKYSQFIDVFYTYSNFPSSPIFNNFSRCILELERIRGNYFKDEEKKLINALIQFFKWRTSNQSDLILATSKFDTYWESMVEVFLNGKFSRIDPKTDKIEWSSKFQISGKKFFKPEKEAAEANRPKDADYSIGGRMIQFDHFHINELEKEIILLDSKYFNQTSFKELNYKQAFYYYHLKSIYGNEYKIFNGLIAPTSGEYRVKVHVNRQDKTDDMTDEKIDGLKIVEHYINMAEAIEYSKENLSTFLSTLSQNEI